jgi:hypothetical protein
MKRHMHLSELSLQDVKDILSKGPGYRKGVDANDKRLAFLEKAYSEDKRDDYRIDRKTWIERDNQGERSRPSNLSDWPECTVEDAEYTLAWGVWCDAVRFYNLENM